MVKKSKTKIVILGAGFAGVKAAQVLSKSLSPSRFLVTVVDKRSHHIFNADLYEVATSYNQKITQECLTKVRETVATPLSEIFDKEKTKFIKDEVVSIDPQAKVITLQKQQLPFDYLVVALGSVANYYRIPGLKQYSYPLKDDLDALKINCDLDHYFQRYYQKAPKDIYVNIGGGGATGVETAAELVGYLKKLSKKYKYPFKRVHITLIEGTNVLAGQDSSATAKIKKRLSSLGIKVYLNSFITKATKDSVTIKPKKGPSKKLSSDILIWNGGVKSNPIVAKYLGNPQKGGAILVNEYLQSVKSPFIFAAGDNAYFPDPEDQTKRLPMLAQIADSQGKAIANNLIRIFQNKPALAYNPEPHFYIVPLGGTYAFFKLKKHMFFGKWCWYLRRIAYLKYMSSILPFFKALKKCYLGTKAYKLND